MTDKKDVAPSPEYKNGYNACSEDVVKTINDLIMRTYTPSSSIHSALLEIKHIMLTKVYFK